jgi:hypothetical protein
MSLTGVAAADVTNGNLETAITKGVASVVTGVDVKVDSMTSIATRRSLLTGHIEVVFSVSKVGCTVATLSSDLINADFAAALRTQGLSTVTGATVTIQVTLNADPSSQPSRQPSSMPSGQPTASPSYIFTRTPMNLGTCKAFAVQGGTKVTFDGESTNIYSGSVGVSPGTSITGGYNLYDGAVEPNSVKAIGCIGDLGIAYRAARAAICNVLMPMEDLAGMTLKPGVYCSASGAFVHTEGALTLDGAGASFSGIEVASQWIFQTATHFITSPKTSVILKNGALAENIWWAIGSSATLGFHSSLYGSVLAAVSITVNHDAVIVGRTLALAAVSYESAGMITLPSQPFFPSYSPSWTPPPTGQPTNSPSSSNGSPVAKVSVVKVKVNQHKNAF